MCICWSLYKIEKIHFSCSQRRCHVVWGSYYNTLKMEPLSLETTWTPRPSTQRRILCNTAPSKMALELQNGQPRLLWEGGLTRPGHKADRPPPYSVEVKNVKVYLTPLHTFMARTGRSLQFSEVSEITKRKMRMRLESSSHILPNISGTVSRLFLVSSSHTHTHTHTNIYIYIYIYIYVTEAILTILGSQHKRKTISFTPGAARSGSVRLSNVTPAFQLTEVKVASLRSSHTITQYYTFPQLSHAVKTPTIGSIFTHTHTRRTYCGNKQTNKQKKKKKRGKQ